MLLIVSPADVKFTQESVAMSFYNEIYGNLNDTIKKIAHNELSIESIRPIRVTVMNNNFYRYLY